MSGAASDMFGSKNADGSIIPLVHGGAPFQLYDVWVVPDPSPALAGKKAAMFAYSPQLQAATEALEVFAELKTFLIDKDGNTLVDFKATDSKLLDQFSQRNIVKLIKKLEELL